MDKSREQFLEWFSKEYEEVNNSTELSAQVIKMIASAAWQASREAVEIELDDKVMVEDEFDKGHNCAIDYCAESIRAAGLKVKGE
ncbi:hypothetical protein AUM47_17220 [Cronobacter malonaticus]|uniref:hypothetical protein n=1 Tax=Cronobacter malonaticus TaxID=413503 RepID=UPI000518048F|nr:hypothetical protein [Cronobacter malonaticus]EGT4373208.1 hypothetical protein [Cronobacter malonaticus]MDI6469468.1 hypothetical protein [Cronobacter malonaticus]HAU5445712.1 hypothetical protein [Cronobacter malonaticus]